MSTGIIVGIVAVIVIGAVVFGVMVVSRRRRLQQRFVEGLDIQPLTDSARARYAGQWTSIQEQVVDAPRDAVFGAQLLVAAVMTERGYRGRT